MKIMNKCMIILSLVVFSLPNIAMEMKVNHSSLSDKFRKICKNPHQKIDQSDYKTYMEALEDMTKILYYNQVTGLKNSKKTYSNLSRDDIENLSTNVFERGKIIFEQSKISTIARRLI